MTENNQSLPPPELELAEESLTDRQYDRFCLVRNYIQATVFASRSENPGFRIHTQTKILHTVTPAVPTWTPVLETLIYTFHRGSKIGLARLSTDLDGERPIMISRVDPKQGERPIRLKGDFYVDRETIRSMISGQYPEEEPDVIYSHDSHFIGQIERWIESVPINRVLVQVSGKETPLVMYMSPESTDVFFNKPDLWIEYTGYPARTYNFIDKERIN